MAQLCAVDRRVRISILRLGVAPKSVGSVPDERYANFFVARILSEQDTTICDRNPSKSAIVVVPLAKRFNAAA